MISKCYVGLPGWRKCECEIPGRLPREELVAMEVAVDWCIFLSARSYRMWTGGPLMSFLSMKPAGTMHWNSFSMNYSHATIWSAVSRSVPNGKNNKHTFTYPCMIWGAEAKRILLIQTPNCSGWLGDASSGQSLPRTPPWWELFITSLPGRAPWPGRGRSRTFWSQSSWEVPPEACTSRTPRGSAHWSHFSLISCKFSSISGETLMETECRTAASADFFSHYLTQMQTNTLTNHLDGSLVLPGHSCFQWILPP